VSCGFFGEEGIEGDSEQMYPAFLINGFQVVLCYIGHSENQGACRDSAKRILIDLLVGRDGQNEQPKRSPYCAPLPDM
jgi:hypothetical protein